MNTIIEDKVFSNKNISIMFHYYVELFKGISSELFEKDLAECIKTDTSYSDIHATVPIEAYMKCAIVYNAMDFENPLKINQVFYYEYLAKHSVPISFIVPSVDYKIKNAEDLEIYALCLINGWSDVELSNRNSLPVKTIGENMAI